ncbi:MAG: chemotaxis protein CheW [Methylococcaceae bacterium]|nr:MAG: chemotaxis protein CheW [Methylococcaceae bacterium]
MGALVKTTQAVDKPLVSHGSRQFLTFLLGGEMFAIDILRIKEIIEYGQVTPVPMVPDFIRGVINLRGSVVPVIYLSIRFGHAPTETTRRTCIVIVEVECEGGKLDIGIIVDSVSEVLEIPDSEIEPPPSFGAKIRADFIDGMGKVDGRFVILLDIARVLSLDELTMLTAMGTEKGTAVEAAGAA